MESFGLKHTIAPLLSLFASASTLVCCALPALLVSLGMGAVMAGLATNVPGLVWLSQHKLPVFGAAALLIALSGLMMMRARRLPCPVDPAQARLCARLRKTSWIIWSLSLAAFATGAFFAFIAPYILV